MHPLSSRLILEQARAEQKASAAVESKEPAAAAPAPEQPKKQAVFDDPLRALGLPLAPTKPNTGASKPKFVDPLLNRGNDDETKAPSSSSSSPSTSGATAATSTADTSASTSSASSSPSSSSSTREDFEFWSEKCPRIFAKYVLSNAIAVDPDFLADDLKSEDALTAGAGAGGAGAKTAKAVDQASSRLEELSSSENPTSERSKNFMNQKEYMTHIEDQHKRLRTAWDAGERVLALRIAIQCAKLLGDTSVPTFYPSMYVLLTRVLDTFGELVYQRIKSRGVDVFDTKSRQMVSVPLPNSFKSSDVSASAKETCRNWFYKTACIRELLPRFYVDLALIKCYRFLEDDSFINNLSRLGKSTRGMGDPLVATYARAFLTSKALDMSYAFIDNRPPPSQWTVVAAPYRRAVLEAFDDFMFAFKCHRTDSFATVAAVASKKVTADEFVDLFSPAVEWVLQNIGYRAGEELFFAMLQQYRDCAPNSMVLNHIIAAFPAPLVATHALTLSALIKEAEENPLSPRPTLYLTLAKALIKSPPPTDQRLAILNDVWKVVTKVQDTTQYLEIAEVFVEFLLQYFSTREVNIFLRDVIKHAKKDDAYKVAQHQVRLEAIATKVMQYAKDIESSLVMDTFLPLVDLLEREHKVKLGRLVLESWAQRSPTTSDPVVIHTVFDIARAVHDNITALSSSDDSREAGRLISAFVRSVDYGNDLEQALKSFGDFRAAFTSLDPVIIELVQRVSLLAIRAHAIMRGKHNKKTAAFVKEALAYTLITIPSLDDYFERLRLYLVCGEVALLNQMVVQCEGFVRAALTLLPEVPGFIMVFEMRRSTDPAMQAYMLNLASFLLLCPGHPKHGPFYLVNGLLGVIQKYAPWEGPSQAKVQVYLGILRLFAAYAQQRFIYRVPQVDSNDALYAADGDYIAQIQPFVEKLVEMLLVEIEKVGASKDSLARKAQVGLALDFANVILSSYEMTPTSATMVFNLLKLASDNKDVADAKYVNATFDAITTRKGKWYADLAGKLRDQGGFAHRKEAGASA